MKLVRILLIGAWLCIFTAVIISLNSCVADHHIFSHHHHSGTVVDSVDCKDHNWNGEGVGHENHNDCGE